jgi:phosphopantetheine--protein transferase-like protein
VAAALGRFGDRYIRRVFTDDESEYCRRAAGPAAAGRFAARFAAKEAAIKALRPRHPWTDWRAIEIRRQKSGACVVELHGDAWSLARRRGIERLSLSMTHEGKVAAAVVVAIGPTPRRHTFAPERRHVLRDHK